MTKLRCLIIDNFDSFTYNLYQYCAELKGNPMVVRNNEISLNDIEQGNFTHIILSPGPGSPDNSRDFGICGEVIRGLKYTPLLGVCLGHQGIIHELGGKVIRAPVPVHGKQSSVTLDTRCPLFEGLPNKIDAMRYHSLIGERETLPDSLKIIAETDGLIMGVAHVNRPLFGIQFHPESIGTPHGKRILQNFFNSNSERTAQRRIPALSGVLSRASLQINTEEEAEQTLDEMLAGRFSEDQMYDIVSDLAARGETVDEIVGMARSMRTHAVKIEKPFTCLDTCGTGGSGLQRMNISTTVAFVLASLGVCVAKHGNRAASGRCGSFDLLEKLGVAIELSAEEVVATLREENIAFLFAPLFHPAMKILAPVRKKIGRRTIFNLLGPLTNPLSPEYQLLGVPSQELGEKMAEALRRLGTKRAYVVSGEDGLDEITLRGKTHIYKVENNAVSHDIFRPEDIGIFSVKDFSAIGGGCAQKNAALFELLLRGKAPQELADLLLVNCACALAVCGKANSLEEGLGYARSAIASGRAYEKFNRYKKLSNKLSIGACVAPSRSLCSLKKLPRFLEAISGKGSISIVAEIKRRSPSHGEFPQITISRLVDAYETGGARAISVVTDAPRFGGSLDMVREVRSLTRLPILRKDFIHTKADIIESARAGADAVLLIARNLSREDLEKLAEEACAMNMTPVIEVHSRNDAEKIMPLMGLHPGKIAIGINNRNLETLHTDVTHGLSLLEMIPSELPIIIESAFSEPAQLNRYHGRVDAALIGTSLLTAPSPQELLSSFVYATQK